MGSNVIAASSLFIHAIAFIARDRYVGAPRSAAARLRSRAIDDDACARAQRARAPCVRRATANDRDRSDRRAAVRSMACDRSVRAAPRETACDRFDRRTTLHAIAGSAALAAAPPREAVAAAVAVGGPAAAGDTLYFRRADIPQLGRGDAVAATWTFRRDRAARPGTRRRSWVSGTASGL